MTPRDTGRSRFALFGGVDWSTVLLGVPLVLALVFLWRFTGTTQGLTAELNMLTRSLESMSPKEGDQLTLPATLPTLRGTTVPLLPETQRSLWVFFSTGCVACMQDLPSWEQLEQSLAAEGTITRFLSIDNETDARRAVGRTKVELSLAPKDLTRALRLDRIPYYILVGPEGRIEWAHRGRLLAADKEVLLSRVKQHLVATLQ